MSEKKQISYSGSTSDSSITLPGSENFNKNSNLLAWWGTIYPQFCFMEVPRTENGQKAEPRFHFWIVETLLFAKNTSRNVTSEP